MTHKVENNDREDVDIDIDNNNNDIDRINVVESWFESPVVNGRIYSGEGKVCRRASSCTLSFANTDPFLYGDTPCQFMEPTAGPNDHYTEVDNPDKKPGFSFSNLKYNVHIDVHGYMQCLINGRLYPKYRKYHLTGGVNKVTMAEYVQYEEELYAQFPHFVFYSGWNEWYNRKFELFIDIYH